jgi:hypothetical protein
LDGLVNFNLDDLSFNYFSLLSDTDTNRFSESLSQGFSLGHFKREDFRTSKHSERGFFTEGFSHTHSNCGFSSSGLSTNKNGSSSDFTIANHAQDNTSCSSAFSLADHTL